MWQSTCSACPGPSDVENTMRPLDGIKVVTLEHAIVAPFCTRQLADLGARVPSGLAPKCAKTTKAGTPWKERNHYIW